MIGLAPQRPAGLQILGSGGADSLVDTAGPKFSQFGAVVVAGLY